MGGEIDVLGGAATRTESEVRDEARRGSPLPASERVLLVRSARCRLRHKDFEQLERRLGVQTAAVAELVYFKRLAGWVEQPTSDASYLGATRRLKKDMQSALESATTLTLSFGNVSTGWRRR